MSETEQADRRPVGGRHHAHVGLGASLGAATFVVALALALVPFTGTSAGYLDNGSRSGSSFWGGHVVTKGVMVSFPLMVADPSSQDAVLLSAQLLPVPGFRTPQLRHLAVLQEHRMLLTSAVGLPLTVHGCSPHLGRCRRGVQTLPTVPFRGFVVSSNSRHASGPMPDMIEYTVSDSHVGTYGVAGLLLSYRVGRTVYEQRLYDGGLLCVDPAGTHRCSTSSFDAAFSKLAASG